MFRCAIRHLQGERIACSKPRAFYKVVVYVTLDTS